MSNADDGLPIAGFEVDYPDRGVRLTTRLKGKTFTEDTEIHELVRRRDHEKDKEQALETQRQEFAELIQDKIATLEEVEEKRGSETRTQNAKAARHEFEELLDEVEQDGR